jgi:flagellar basal-body rod modification protein FlgD
MATTPAVASATGGSGTSATSTQTVFSNATDGLGRDAFLKLLIAQLQNQDPMKPMEDKDFIAQLAQFSSLETLQNLEQRFDSMLLAQAIDQAAGLVGKHVEAEQIGVDGTTHSVSGSVSEVRVVAGVPRLLVSGQEVLLSQVTRVSP